MSGESHNIYEKRIRFGYHNFGITQGLNQYKFVTPWMALNQSNYYKYIRCDEQKKTELLKKVLIGNLLSMSKTLEYHVDQVISVMLQVEPINVNFKNQKCLLLKDHFL